MKYCLSLFLALSISIVSFGQSASFQNDFKLIRYGIANYLYESAQNSWKYAPAGTETGCLNDKMNTRKMDKLADPLDEYKFYSVLGSSFYEMFYTFSLQNQQAFRECGNHIEMDMKPQHTLYSCTECNINHLLDISNHMLRLHLPMSYSDSLLADVRDHVLNLYESVNHGNNSAKDCHATGWITWQVHNAARAGMDRLNTINVNNRNSTAGKLGMVMNHFYKDLIALPVQDFDTWLSPEWQVGYYTIMYSTYLELTNMDFSPSATSYLGYSAKKHDK